MLLINDIRADKEGIITRLAKRGVDFTDLVNSALSLDDKRKSTQVELDNTLAEANKISKAIGQLFAQKKIEEANAMKAKTGELKEKSNELSEQLKAAETELLDVLYQIPNAPGAAVPAGKSAADNKIVLEHGDKPNLTQKQPHWELCEKYNLIDFELGVKITGAGFPVYRGKGARLQRALINWFLDKGRDAGFEEIQPPILVNEASGIGTGQLPDKEGQMYHMEVDNLYAIPTGVFRKYDLKSSIVKEADFKVSMQSPKSISDTATPILEEIDSDLEYGEIPTTHPRQVIRNARRNEQLRARPSKRPWATISRIAAMRRRYWVCQCYDVRYGSMECCTRDVARSKFCVQL